jgi:CheY-like chemotaxis protein
MLLAELLAGMGHDVCATAATEADAVAAAIRYRPDLIVVDDDLGQGGGSGVSAIEEILRTAPVAHVFVTGAPGTVQALRPGDVVVRKPFREADLVRAIDITLDGATAG